MPDQDDGPPTVVSLEWDHCYPSPLVDRSPGVLPITFLEPGELGLSDALVQRLMSWLDRMPSWDPDVERDPEWGHEGLTLAYDLQHELGPDVTVVHGDRPISEHRGP